jgi:hypothetical protein
MNDFEYIDEPEEPSIGFPFNVPDEFLDNEEEEDDLTVVRQILKFMEVAA